MVSITTLLFFFKAISTILELLLYLKAQDFQTFQRMGQPEARIDEWLYLIWPPGQHRAATPTLTSPPRNPSISVLNLDSGPNSNN